MDKDFRVKLGLHVGANAYISNSISHVESIVFANTLANYSPRAGEMFWNSDDRTLDLETGGTLLQLGQEQYYLVKNQTGNTISDGQAVMATGTLGASGRILATPAIADGTFPSEYFMGIATETIANGDDGFVTSFGVVREIDTGMFSEGDVLYADPQVPGGLSNTAPAAPNNFITAAIVINSSNTTGSVFVRPSFGSKLQNLEDVVLNGIADGGVLAWSAANSRFEASSVAGGYSDSSVDAHLNVGTASANQVLSWDGADYSWVDQSAGGGGASVTTSNTAPTPASDGDLWFNEEDGALYLYYEDADSNQWVGVSGSQGPAGTPGITTGKAIAMAIVFG